MTAAPPCQHIRSASSAPGHLSGGFAMRCRMAADFTVSNMFWLSLLDAPSDPSATLTPARTSAGAGAMPAPSFWLLTGLWTMPASVSPSIATSSSLSQMPCANEVHSCNPPRLRR